MDAGTLTTPIAGRERRGLVASLRRRARLFRRARAVAAARVELLRVDESIELDPALLDRDEWLAWGREHLTAEQFERRRRAVEADRAAQPEAVC